MNGLKDIEQASYTAEPTAVDLSVIIETYTALLAGDNLPERVAVQTVVLQTLLDAAALSSAPSPEAVRREALEAIRDINIREEVDSYEWRGDNGGYTPNDKEKELLEDFGAGIIGLVEDAIRALQSTQPEPAVKVDDYFGTLVIKARAAAVKASLKFPQPNYVTLKIAEEAGEVVRGAVRYAEGRLHWSEVEGEIVQLMAMLIRFVTEGDQINGITPPANLNRIGGAE